MQQLWRVHSHPCLSASSDKTPKCLLSIVSRFLGSKTVVVTGAEIQFILSNGPRMSQSYLFKGSRISGPCGWVRREELFPKPGAAAREWVGARTQAERRALTETSSSILPSWSELTPRSPQSLNASGSFLFYPWTCLHSCSASGRLWGS